MVKVMRIPSRYVQGRDALLHMKEQTSMLGDSYYIISNKSALNEAKEKIEKSFKGSSCKLVFELFSGQCSMDEINRIREIVRKNNSNVIVGLGGGRSIDTAKAVAYFENLPVVIIPTIASTDAPCTALSVIYSNEGDFGKYIYFPKSPDVVIVDTEIIAKAPVKFLVAGMGDALSTYFEVRACVRSNSLNLVGGEISMAGYAAAKLCYETIIDYGYKAKLAVEKGALTPAVEKVVEAAIYLSGIGVDNGGLAAAHAVNNGFTVLDECKKTMHGELVAFGTLVQLVLEDCPEGEIEEVLNFCLRVGLPITLEQIGIKEVNEEKIRKVAKTAIYSGENIHNMPFDVTVDSLYDAIIAADNIGRQAKQIMGNKSLQQD